MQPPHDDSIDKTIKGHKMYPDGTTLSITISPPIAMQSFLFKRKNIPTDTPMFPDITASERRINFIQTWLKYFKQLSLSKFTFYLEYSQYGLLHWHGTVRVRSSKQFHHEISYLKYIQKVNVDIDTIDDSDYWERYQSKDNDIMNVKITHKTKLVRPITDYITTTT